MNPSGEFHRARLVSGELYSQRLIITFGKLWQILEGISLESDLIRSRRENTRLKIKNVDDLI